MTSPELVRHQTVTFEGLVMVMQSIKKYWFDIVELPADDS